MRLTRSRSCWLGFENLGSDDVIIPGMANLSFNIRLTSAVDANRTLVSNIGRAIIKKLAVKFEGNEIMSVDDFNVLACYRDLWKTKSEKRNAINQGISTDGCTENCIKLRINAGDKNTEKTQINKTNDHILNLTPENVTQHSRIVTTTRKGSSTPTEMSKIIGRQIH